MPTVTITDAQLAALEDIQGDLEAAYIDTYGHIRPQDAMQYLLDTYTPPAEQHQTDTNAYEIIAEAEFPQLQRVAADVDEVPGSGIESATMRGMLLTTLGVDEFAARLQNHATADGETESDDESGGAHEETTDSAAESDPEDTSSEPAGESDSILSAANQLLETHSKKWREASGSEEPYEVELPDGTAVAARTKDDVRQLLFKHY
ncbi:hypothetical protein [Halobellus rufus]|uniref:hypothetical protein n=1 Tax=Halobellus rufus TaxID=1448860 RepID=UPI000679944D|nr:hypothetical protein [Halobellus rufus]